MSDPKKSILCVAMSRIEEFDGPRVRPNGLSLFKPNPVFAIVDPVLRLVPLKPYIRLYAIVYTQSSISAPVKHEPDGCVEHFDHSISTY